MTTKQKQEEQSIRKWLYENRNTFEIIGTTALIAGGLDLPEPNDLDLLVLFDNIPEEIQTYIVDKYERRRAAGTMFPTKIYIQKDARVGDFLIARGPEYRRMLAARQDLILFGKASAWGLEKVKTKQFRAGFTEAYRGEW